METVPSQRSICFSQRSKTTHAYADNWQSFLSATESMKTKEEIRCRKMGVYG